MSNHSVDITKPPKPDIPVTDSMRNAIAKMTIHPQEGSYKSTSTAKDRKLKKRSRQNRKKGRR